MIKQVFMMHPEMQFLLKVGDRLFLAHAEANAKQHAAQTKQEVETIYRDAALNDSSEKKDEDKSKSNKK